MKARQAVAAKFLPRLPAAESSWGFLQVQWEKLCRLIEERLVTTDASLTSTGQRLSTLEAGFVISSASATYAETATAGVRIIQASGTFTINLPTAVGNKARYTVKLVSAGTVTLDPAGAETIDGAATVAISTLNQAVTIVSNGTNWIKI